MIGQISTRLTALSIPLKFYHKLIPTDKGPPFKLHHYAYTSFAEYRLTLSMWGGQLLPVASTGISSYFSKFIPVLLPEKSSLKIKVCQSCGQMQMQDSCKFCYCAFTSRICLTVPGAHWEQWAWTNHHLWSLPPSGCFLHQQNPHAHICTHSVKSVELKKKPLKFMSFNTCTS